MACKKNAKYSYDNIPYCKAHYNIMINKRTSEIKLENIKKNKCTSFDPQQLATQMYEKLDSLPGLLDSDEVVIENQPGLINPTMKTVSSLLFGYFIMRGVIDRKENSIRKVNFISASNKLKIDESKINIFLKTIPKTDKLYDITNNLLVKYCQKIKITKGMVIDYNFYGGEKNLNKLSKLIFRYIIGKKTTSNKIKELQSNPNYKLFDNFIKILDKFNEIADMIIRDEVKYDILKLLSIKYTEFLLSNDKKWLDHLSKFKKKDDLCDSFLQAYYRYFSLDLDL